MYRKEIIILANDSGSEVVAPFLSLKRCSRVYICFQGDTSHQKLLFSCFFFKKNEAWWGVGQWHFYRTTKIVFRNSLFTPIENAIKKYHGRINIFVVSAHFWVCKSVSAVNWPQEHEKWHIADRNMHSVHAFFKSNALIRNIFYTVDRNWLCKKKHESWKY